MPQRLHPDFDTNPPTAAIAGGTSYFFFGNGSVQAAIQSTADEACTMGGLLLSDPAKFSRKWSTDLFHPEFGLEKTLLTVVINGVRFRPHHGSSRVYWDVSKDRPHVHLEWSAGNCLVNERFDCDADTGAIGRELVISSGTSSEISVEVPLYANPTSYSRFGGDTFGLWAKGDRTIRITSHTEGIFSERTLRIPVTISGDRSTVRISYSFDDPIPDANRPNTGLVEPRTTLSVRNPSTRNPEGDRLTSIAKLFAKCCEALSAVVSKEGRFDASIWQYGFEWSGDASIVAEALIYSGQHSRARSVLENILTHLTNADGMAMESSRFRGGQNAELNNNGEILKAVQTYFEWTADRDFVKRHYARIRAIANYLLRPEFFNPERSMLTSSRDIWERNAATGILPGYDIAHQTFGILGLRAAAALASALEHDSDSERWSKAANKIADRSFGDAVHSMFHNGRVIKRRLFDGTVQTALEPVKTEAAFLKTFVPSGMPLSNDGARNWEPDVSELFPICFGLIDPKCDVAQNTLAEIERLWSQAWDFGGYGRYNVESEPDSPGPWPFATAFAAAAHLEAGNFEKAFRAIDWLIESAGEAGSWFEFYGDRPTPPLPPTGIIVWGWAQFIILIAKHVLGVEVVGDELYSNPKVIGLDGEFCFRTTQVTL